MTSMLPFLVISRTTPAIFRRKRHDILPASIAALVSSDLSSTIQNAAHDSRLKTSNPSFLINLQIVPPATPVFSNQLRCRVRRERRLGVLTSHDSRVTSHGYRSTTRAFSSTCESLLPQLLCFLIYTNPRGWGQRAILGFSLVTSHQSQVTCFHGPAASLPSLCSDLTCRFLCFQQLTDTFCRLGGWGCTLTLSSAFSGSPPIASPAIQS